MEKIKIANIIVKKNSDNINGKKLKFVQFYLGSNIVIITRIGNTIMYDMRMKITGCDKAITFGTVDKLTGEIDDPETIRVNIETLVENSGINIPYSSHVIKWMADVVTEILIEYEDKIIKKKCYKYSFY